MHELHPILKLTFWLLCKLALAAIVLCVESVRADDYNTQLLASVRVGRNGGCSGTAFAVDAEYAYVASAWHCIRVGETAVGQRVGICTVDGKIHQGEWIAFDDHLDLAVARIPLQAALAVAGIPASAPVNSGNWVAVGYPNSVGPNLKSLGTASISGRTKTANGWRIPVESGTFAGGDSGGGIFDGGTLIGVTTHGDVCHRCGQVHEPSDIRAATHDQLFSFVSSVPPAAKAMGLPECPDGQCKVCPDCGKIHAPSGGWKPQPNKPIVLPDKVPSDGTFPDKRASEYIVELTKRVDRQDQIIAELQQAVAALQRQPGQPVIPTAPAPAPMPERGEVGPRGPIGPDGPAGSKGDPGPSRTITVILKWHDGTMIAEREVPPDKTKLTQILRKVSSATK